MSEKDRNRISIVKTIVLISIIVVIGVVIWLLTTEKETRITSTSSGSTYSSLDCSSSYPENSLFISDTAQKYTHIVKVLFINDSLKEVSYRFEGTYNSEESAEKAGTHLHIQYNQYMSENGVNAESLNPVFSINKSKLMISLYAEAAKINNTVARLFFMKGEDIEKENKFMPEDYLKMYEAKGFTCNIGD